MFHAIQHFWQNNKYKLLNILYGPSDISSLAFTRIVLGVLLLIDTVYERGLSKADIIWSVDMLDRCRFPLWQQMDFHLSVPFIYALYALMVIGQLGLTLGYRYRICSLLYCMTYWLLFIQDRSRWNNHSYLFGLLATMFSLNDSNRMWSMDVFLGRIQPWQTVPHWQYFLLRFQIFLVYFYAGLKKTNPDWLLGYSMINLSKNWVFRPARYLIPSYWIDYYLIHLGGFLFDSLVGFMFLWAPSRWLAFILCSAFNMINSQLFQIGMFPWVMLAMMPIFCRVDWPTKLIGILLKKKQQITLKKNKHTNKHDNARPMMTIFILLYVIIQICAPFAFIMLAGLNTWTSGMYGYNWDMMVHNWNHLHSQLKVQGIEPNSNRTIVRYLNTDSWTANIRWSHHADMAKQLALCLHNKFTTEMHYRQVKVFVDVWTSLNGRFAQRIFDPSIDLVRAEWSIWQKPKWVVPIYEHSNYWRRRLLYDFGERFDHLIQDNIKNGSVALFMTDKTGYDIHIHVPHNLFDRHTHLIVFHGQLRVKTRHVNGSIQMNVLETNGQLLVWPGSTLHMNCLATNETYFALLYPKLTNRRKRDTDKSIKTCRSNRNAWSTSVRFVMIGIRYLLWDGLIEPMVNMATEFTLEIALFVKQTLGIN